MAVSDRRARHRANLRREILDAASRLFVEEGYQRVTMRRVAARIEYSPTTIYLYFTDKQELFEAICEETFSQLAAKLDRLKIASNTPVAQLREGLRTYVEFGLKHPAHYMVTFLQPRKGHNSGQFEGSIGARAFDGLRQSVAACAATGDIKTTSVDATAQACWAAVHGLTSLLITDNGLPLVTQKALIDHLLDVLMAGLKTPPATTRSTAAPAVPLPRPSQTPKPFSFMD